MAEPTIHSVSVPAEMQPGEKVIVEIEASAPSITGHFTAKVRTLEGHEVEVPATVQVPDQLKYAFEGGVAEGFTITPLPDRPNAFELVAPGGV